MCYYFIGCSLYWDWTQVDACAATLLAVHFNWDWNQIDIFQLRLNSSRCANILLAVHFNLNWNQVLYFNWDWTQVEACATTLLAVHSIEIELK